MNAKKSFIDDCLIGRLSPVIQEHSNNNKKQDLSWK
jgi:hypothetical protein